MKIFLSQAMNGRNEEEIKKEINLAKSMLLIKYPDAEFISTFVENGTCENHKNFSVWCLGHSLEWLSDADLCVYISDTGWSLPRGCQIEHNVCRDYGIPYAQLWVQEDVCYCENTPLEEP